MKTLPEPLQRVHLYIQWLKIDAPLGKLWLFLLGAIILSVSTWHLFPQSGLGAELKTLIATIESWVAGTLFFASFYRFIKKMEKRFRWFVPVTCISLFVTIVLLSFLLPGSSEIWMEFWNEVMREVLFIVIGVTAIITLIFTKIYITRRLSKKP